MRNAGSRAGLCVQAFRYRKREKYIHTYTPLYNKTSLNGNKLIIETHHGKAG